jgi:hypothetical protein
LQLEQISSSDRNQLYRSDVQKGRRNINVRDLEKHHITRDPCSAVSHEGQEAELQQQL